MPILKIDPVVGSGVDWQMSGVNVMFLNGSLCEMDVQI